MATPKIQSVDRAFALLNCLAKASGSESLPRLAEQCHLTVATTHRLLATLESLGAVIHTRPGEYRIGMGLVELTRNTVPEALLVAAAEPAMRKIIQSLGYTAHVGVMEDNFMVTYVAKMARKSHSVPTRIGSQLEAYCSGLGKVLLSALPEAERRRYVWEDNFPALTSNTITAPDALERELERVERQGYAVDDCKIFDNLRCVAVPIHDQAGRVIASLSTSAPADVIRPVDVPEVASRLAEHAAMIGSKLYPKHSSGLRAQLN